MNPDMYYLFYADLTFTFISEKSWLIIIYLLYYVKFSVSYLPVSFRVIIHLSFSRFAALNFFTELQDKLNPVY
jgi:hypothetical protein